MIRVIVNGEEREYDEKEYPNFSDLWNEVAPDDMVITKLVINGNEVPISKMDEVMKAKFEGGEIVEMTFKSVGEAAIDLIDEALDYIASIREHIELLALNISKLDPQGGLKNFQKLIEGITALENMRKSMVKLTRRDVKEMNLEDTYEEVKGIFEGVNTALDARDYDELARILKEEFPKVLEFYRTFLEKSKVRIMEMFNTSEREG